MSIPFDIAALSAQVWNSLSDDDESNHDPQDLSNPNLKSILDSNLDFDPSTFLDHQLHHQSDSWESHQLINQDPLQELHHQLTSQALPNPLLTSTTIDESHHDLIHQDLESLLSSQPHFNTPTHLHSLHDDFHQLIQSLSTQPHQDHLSQINPSNLTPMDEVDLMLDQLFNPDPIPSPPSLHSTSFPSTATIKNLSAIDPFLESIATSPPTTLSTPQSPQPILRTDASTSQHLSPPSLPPPPPPLLPPSGSLSTLPLLAHRSGPSVSTASLDQLANPPSGEQPNYPWWTIIRAAIMGSRYGMMTREEICEALVNRWDYFRLTDEHDTRVWKSAVGHNLSVKECFVRVFVEGEGNMSYYIVDTAVDPAKGRLSKGKNTSNPDRVTVPTIARRPVLPSNLNLSTQARWSPAIAAIRNAKYGLPEIRSGPTQHAHVMESDSDEDEDDSDDSDSGESSETHLAPHPFPGSLLGSSLGAIVGSSRPPVPKHPIRSGGSRPKSTPLRPVGPRLTRPMARPMARPGSRPAQSMARHSNGLSRTGPPHRRPNPRPNPRPSISRRRPNPPPPALIPIPPQPIPVFSSPPPLPTPPPRSPSPLPLSLEEQVAAALADVTAIVPHQLAHDASMGHQEPPQQDEAEALSTEPSQPLFDFENLMKKVQAEIGIDVEEGDDESSRSNSEEDQLELDTEDHVDLDMMIAAAMPTLSDLEGPDAHEHHRTEEDQTETLADLVTESLAAIQTDEPTETKKRSADDAGLGNLLQSLIDEASHEDGPRDSSPALLMDNLDDSEDEDGPGLSLAERHLDDAIAHAMAEAEAQAQEKLVKDLEAREKARMKALSERITSSLAGVVQLTPSGDIPVHPLPLPPAPPTSPVLQPTPPPPVRGSQHYARPRAVMVRRPMMTQTRPTWTASNTTSVRPKTTNLIIDRRTRASGVRNPGRRLNLPLPSAHTAVDDRIDETALAPSLLESIQVVTLDRPRNTFPELAKEAILSHPGGKMTAAEIFKVVEKKYPYFVTAPESWKATMRNVLTSHSCFVKVPRPADAPGRGDWWSTVDLPLWKRRRTTAKAKADEDFLGRHTREQIRKSHRLNMIGGRGHHGSTGNHAPHPPPHHHLHPHLHQSLVTGSI